MKFTNRSMIFVLSLAALGCGKTTPPALTAPSLQDLDAHYQSTGPISKRVDAITHSKWASDCDKSFEQMRLEITTAVDANAERIQKALASASATSDNAKLIPFFGSNLEEYPEQKPDGKGWQKNRYSWHRLYRYFKAKKEKGDDAFWIYINNRARGILWNDESRILYGRNYGLTRENLDLLPDLKAELDRCKSDSSCVELKLSKPLKDLVSNVEFYAYASELLDNEKDIKKKREILEGLSKRVDGDLYYPMFRENDSVITKKSGAIAEMELTFIHPGFSEADQKVLSGAIEKVWTSKERAVHVKFASQQQTPKLFEIFFKNEPSERASTSRTDRTMELFPNTTLKAVAHEFGHALGFSDHYYTTWDSLNCDYSDEYRDDDIMSTHETGLVTAEEWAELEKHYPAK